MLIAIPEAEWRVFSLMRLPEMVGILKALAQQIRLKAYRKSPRGVKKPRPKCEGNPKSSPVSTTKILRNRQTNVATP